MFDRYRLSFIHDNPGEAPFDTVYRDPRGVIDRGFNGVMIWDFFDLALCDEVDPRIFPQGSKGRDWVEQRRDTVGRILQENLDAGLKVFFNGDFVSLPVGMRELFAKDIFHEDGKTIDFSKPLVMDTVGAMVQEVFSVFPGVEGTVIRSGENYIHNTPYLFGNHPHGGAGDGSAGPWAGRAGLETLPERVVFFVSHLQKEICEKANKIFIMRSWDFGPKGWHAGVDTHTEVAKHLPNHKNFVMSFKFIRTDFWAHQDWNQNLHHEKFDTIVELQCQREYEFKGMVPIYQAPKWLGGALENGERAQEEFGLAHAPSANLNSAMVWPRGGGWGGPFPESEMWIDLNMYAASQLFQDTMPTSGEILRSWIGEKWCVDNQLDFIEEQKESLAKLIEDSEQVMIKSRYVEDYAKAKWVKEGKQDAPAEIWFRDNYWSVPHTQNLFRKTKEWGLDVAPMIQEKRDSLEIAKRLDEQSQALFSDLEFPDKAFVVRSFTLLHEFAAMALALFEQMDAVLAHGKKTMNEILEGFPVLKSVIHIEGEDVRPDLDTND